MGSKETRRRVNQRAVAVALRDLALEVEVVRDSAQLDATTLAEVIDRSRKAVPEIEEAEGWRAEVACVEDELLPVLRQAVKLADAAMNRIWRAVNDISPNGGVIGTEKQASIAAAALHEAGVADVRPGVFATGPMSEWGVNVDEEFHLSVRACYAILAEESGDIQRAVRGVGIPVREEPANGTPYTVWVADE